MAHRSELQLKEAEDVEPFLARLSSYGVDEELRQLAKRVLVTKAVQFGTFHTFPLAHLHEDKPRH